MILFAVRGQRFMQPLQTFVQFHDQFPSVIVTVWPSRWCMSRMISDPA
jgi:hypothetical protein